ncbi:MAG: 1-acyl-sn-glycerol-3-phosphate acyltransferase [Rhodospirillales bacterium]
MTPVVETLDDTGWLAGNTADRRMAGLPLHLLAGSRLLLIMVVTAVLTALYLPVAGLRRRRLADRIYRLWAAVVCRICGLRLIVRGQPVGGPGCLYVANHCSYLDIPVLRAILDATFVSRHDVSGWPVLGPLARMTGTLFVERRPARSGEQARQMTGQLEKGQSIILFPEGTSTDGNRVLPFKSSLFAAVERTQGMTRNVQPVTIAYTRLYNLPMSLVERPLFAWYGDMDLAPHLWQLLHIGSATVEITLHQPVRPEQLADRKLLAADCRQSVAEGLRKSLTGRLV